jgi:hypothetical protein
MDLEEIRWRRNEAIARHKSATWHYRRETKEFYGLLEKLQDKCPHDGGAVVCGACGLLIDQKSVAT